MQEKERGVKQQPSAKLRENASFSKREAKRERKKESGEQAYMFN